MRIGFRYDEVLHHLPLRGHGRSGYRPSHSTGNGGNGHPGMVSCIPSQRSQSRHRLRGCLLPVALVDLEPWLRHRRLTPLQPIEKLSSTTEIGMALFHVLGGFAEKGGGCEEVGCRFLLLPRKRPTMCLLSPPFVATISSSLNAAS